MTRSLWATAVCFITVLLTAVSCGTTQVEPALLEITGPAFVFFYTDN